MIDRRMFTQLLAVGGLAGAASVGLPAAASAATTTSKRVVKQGITSDALRDLAEPIGLRVGSALLPQDIETPSYAVIASSQFSTVTPGNAMKWQLVEPEQGVYDWSGADQLVEFAEANDQRVRGHCLVWHNQLPTWLTDGVANGTISDSELYDLLRQHIHIEVSRYRGRIWQWDVCNEFFLDADPSGIDPDNWWVANLGPGILADAYRWAHEADPSALLVYNDYNIGGEDGTNAKSDAVYAWLSQQLSDGVPIHVVGNQGHLDTQYGWSPQLLQSDLERYASLGLKVAITEADVRTFVNDATDQVPTDSLALFAQPYEFEEMMQAALAVPECISFTVWGFTDADSWVPGTFAGEGYATIYDVNLNPKPAYYALQQDLLLASYGAPRRVPAP
jgi:endo-1,4-beta-xylanase